MPERNLLGTGEPTSTGQEAAEVAEDGFYYGYETHPGGAWEELLCVQAGNPLFHGVAPPDAVTAIALDKKTELIWVGTAGGFLHAHMAADMTRYSTAPPILAEVKSIVSVPSFGSVAATPRGIQWFRRGGVPLGSIVDVGPVKDSRVVCLSPFNDNHVFAGGGGSHLVMVDMARRRLLLEAPLGVGVHAAGGVTCAAWPSDSHGLVTASAGGRLSLRDATSLREVASVPAFSGAPTCIVSQNSLVAVSGLSTRRGASFMDESVKVFDSRMLSSSEGGTVSTFLYPSGAWRLAFDSFSAGDQTQLLWCLSMDGLLQPYDISAAVATPFLTPIQLESDNDTFTSLVCSDTGLIVAGDTGGFVHQWAPNDQVTVNFESEPLPSPSIDATLPANPVSVIRGPAARSGDHNRPPAPPKGTLQRALESEVSGTVLAQYCEGEGPHLTSMISLSISKTPHAGWPRTIDPSIMSSRQQQGWVSHVQAPRGFVRNSLMGFLSTHQSTDSKTERACTNEPNDPLLARYARYEVDLVAQEGIEGFDFKKYNNSGIFCGLQNTLANSYVNAGVQSLHYIPHLRQAIATHTCRDELCLTCELGFLFHMLSTGSHDVACEASNFTRALSKTPNAAALGLLDRSDAKTLRSAPERMENLVRYLLEQLNRNELLGRQAIKVLFGAEAITVGRYRTSGSSWERKSLLFQHTLVYDQSSLGDPSFANVVQSSLCREIAPVRAFCDSSSQFEQLAQNRKLLTLPNILTLGCGATSDKYREFWDCLSRRGSNLTESELAREAVAGPKKLDLWLRIEIDPSSGQLTVEGLPAQPESIVPTGDLVAFYRLDFIIAFVSESQHWVSTIRMNDPTSSQDAWWCFNDFHIDRCQSSDEAIAFDPAWKMPSVLGYSRFDLESRLGDLVLEKDVSDCEVLTKATNGAEALTQAEIDGLGGYRAALDCEFVSIDREEFEITSTGQRKIVRPAKLALARVSVIRGQGDRAGLPFIDDYIAIRDPIVDHLTRWSGLKVGDLDPQTSSFRLTTLKIVYLKLRQLLDRGCVFVGHGLKKDFRIINFLVPETQVIDTVELFREPGMRYLSLRFLSATILRTQIQTETHDSIEDADTARKLLLVYEQLESQGRFAKTLRSLYVHGRQHGWTGAGEPFEKPSD